MSMSSNEHEITPELEARIVALVLGEASDIERDELESLIATRADLRAFRSEIARVHSLMAGEVCAAEFAQQLGASETGEAQHVVDMSAAGVEEGPWKLAADRRKEVLSVLHSQDHLAGTTQSSSSAAEKDGNSPRSATLAESSFAPVWKQLRGSDASTILAATRRVLWDRRKLIGGLAIAGSLAGLTLVFDGLTNRRSLTLLDFEVAVTESAEPTFERTDSTWEFSGRADPFVDQPDDVRDQAASFSNQAAGFAFGEQGVDVGQALGYFEGDSPANINRGSRRRADASTLAALSDTLASNLSEVTGGARAEEGITPRTPYYLYDDVQSSSGRESALSGGSFPAPLTSSATPDAPGDGAPPSNRPSGGEASWYYQTETLPEFTGSQELAEAQVVVPNGGGVLLGGINRLFADPTRSSGEQSSSDLALLATPGIVIQDQEEETLLGEAKGRALGRSNADDGTDADGSAAANVWVDSYGLSNADGLVRSVVPELAEEPNQAASVQAWDELEQRKFDTFEKFKSAANDYPVSGSSDAAGDDFGNAAIAGSVNGGAYGGGLDRGLGVADAGSGYGGMGGGGMGGGGGGRSAGMAWRGQVAEGSVNKFQGIANGSIALPDIQLGRGFENATGQEVASSDGIAGRDYGADFAREFEDATVRGAIVENYANFAPDHLALAMSAPQLPGEAPVEEMALGLDDSESYFGLRFEGSSGAEQSAVSGDAAVSAGQRISPQNPAQFYDLDADGIAGSPDQIGQVFENREKGFVDAMRQVEPAPAEFVAPVDKLRSPEHWGAIAPIRDLSVAGLAEGAVDKMSAETTATETRATKPEAPKLAAPEGFFGREQVALSAVPERRADGEEVVGAPHRQLAELQKNLERYQKADEPKAVASKQLLGESVTRRSISQMQTELSEMEISRLSQSITAAAVPMESEALGETRYDRFGSRIALGKGLEKSKRRIAAEKPSPSVSLNEQDAAQEAFSTFSLHVSDVSFKLAKSALAEGKWPEAAKVRIEEFVNAFYYGDTIPSQNQRVAANIEQCVHPFLQQRNLMRVAMRTSATGRASQTPLRLTLLLDNSGSMERADRRETVTRAFELLARQLQPADQVTLISFARQPRLIADAVSGADVQKLGEAIAMMPSEGGTNIEAALQLASEKAQEHFLASAQNRVILFTDGAVNLGDAEPESLSKLVEQMRETGVAFDAAGITAEGLNDEVLEALTRKGDGRYYLLDSAESADAGFARQVAGALRPSAKNVKIQVEFNPQRVGRYKLLGFEKHALKKEDFRNDSVDAAELSAEEAGVAVYQFEAKPDGEGDVGFVSVRFQDVSTGQMVENRWPIPYEAAAPRIEQAAASMKLAGTAALFAAKLRGEPLGDSADLALLDRWAKELASSASSSTRVHDLQQMLQQARELSE